VEPSISIIVAVLNGIESLSRCLHSIFNQTYPYKELIIMDGGSTDGSVELLKRYDSKIKYWESQPDRGIYHAWNKGLDHANGEWICFIGCDDFFFHKEILEEIAPYLIDAKNKGLAYAYGKVALYSDKNKRVIENFNDPWEIMKKRIKRGDFLVHSGSFHHRSLFDNNIRFNERYKICGDRDFLLRKLKFQEAYYINEIIIGMSMSGLSFNLSAKKKLVEEALFIWEDIPMTSFPFSLYFSYIKLKCYLISKYILGESLSIKAANFLRRLRGMNPYWNQ
jgi:glycosyltransferase involved in cell wall biosynthesis